MAKKTADESKDAPKTALKFPKGGHGKPKISKGKKTTHRAPGALVKEEPFALAPTGIVIRGNPTIEQFGEYFDKTLQIGNSVAWAIGDLIVYGEGRADWAEMYAQVLDGTKKSIDSLMNMRNVSKKYTQDRRRPFLSWSHHRVLAAMPELEQDKYLDLCEKEGLSVKELQERLKSEKDLGAPALPFSTKNSNEIVSIVMHTESKEIHSVWQTEGLAKREVAKLNRAEDAKAYESRPFKVQGPADSDGDAPIEDDDSGDESTSGEF